MPEFWDDDQTGAVNNTEDSPVVNFKNLNVLTDYFQKDIMRDAGGNVRHIILLGGLYLKERDPWRRL